MFHIYTTQKDKPFNVSNGRARFYINGGRDVSALGEESGKCIEVDTTLRLFVGIIHYAKRQKN